VILSARVANKLQWAHGSSQCKVEARERTVRYYQRPSGDSPFREWRQHITDLDLKAAVDARVARLRGGNFGDSKPVGKGVSESRVDFGPGYRIYYSAGQDDIILLLAGDKTTQDSDIEAAQGFWEDFKDRTKKERTKENERKHRLQDRSSKRSKK
jgi:putative addiction module killer protein